MCAGICTHTCVHACVRVCVTSAMLFDLKYILHHLTNIYLQNTELTGTRPKVAPDHKKAHRKKLGKNARFLYRSQAKYQMSLAIKVY